MHIQNVKHSWEPFIRTKKQRNCKNPNWEGWGSSNDKVCNCRGECFKITKTLIKLIQGDRKINGNSLKSIRRDK